MKYDPKIHHRRSIRLKNYDYSQAGFYFITIVTQNRECLFGDIVDGEMVLNDAGNVVKKCWDEIPSHYPHIKLYEFVIMPNHIHGIVGAENIPPVQKNIPPVQKNIPPVQKNIPPVQKNIPPVQKNIPPIQNGIARAENIPPIQKNPPLGNVIKGFKIGVTKWFQAEKNHPIGKSIWQRNYWEHIIRSENEYQRIAQYIIDNPQKWSLDKLNGGAGNQVMETPAMYGQKIFYPNDKAWMV